MKPSRIARPEDEVDQPLEQAADEEVQLAQAHQREHVGGEARCTGPGSGRRSPGSSRARRAGRWCRSRAITTNIGVIIALAVLLRRRAWCRAYSVGERGTAARPHLSSGSPRTRRRRSSPSRASLTARVDEERAEEVEDPGELVDRRGADGDEDAAQDQRDARCRPAAPSAGSCAGTANLRHDDDEDEEVVDRQRVLGEPAGEELRGEVGTGEVTRPRGRT